MTRTAPDSASSTRHASKPRRWLFVRGMGRAAAHWGKVVDVFAQRLEAPVHLLDLPGMGRENARRAPLTIAANVADMRRRFLPLVEAERGPWGVLAISLGGMVAMDWCARHPDDFERVVLVNTSAGNVALPHDRFSLRMLPHGLLASFGASVEKRERAIWSMTCNARGRHAAIIDDWIAVSREQPVRGRDVMAQLVAAALYAAPPRLRQPTLVVTSEGDRLVRATCSRALARRLGAELRVHPWSGHDLGTDDPDWLAETVARWVAATP